jgi:hypothetical protein
MHSVLLEINNLNGSIVSLGNISGVVIPLLGGADSVQLRLRG